MDDFNLAPDVLRTKSKEELIEIVRAMGSTNLAAAPGFRTETNFNFEDVIQGLFGDSMIPMIMVDETGRFRRINRAFKEVTGYEDADLIGRLFRVRDLAHKTHATARRVQCEEVTS